MRKMNYIDAYINKDNCEIIEIDNINQLNTKIDNILTTKIILAHDVKKNTLHMYSKNRWLYLNIKLESLPLKLTDARFLLNREYRNFLYCLKNGIIVTFDNVLVYSKEGQCMVLCNDINHEDNTIKRERLVFEI